MSGELKNIQIKMKALGYTQKQINSIIKQCLKGKKWVELNRQEQQDILQNLDNRINFVRKFLRRMSCVDC